LRLGRCLPSLPPRFWPSLRDLAVARTLVLRFVRSTNGKRTDDIGP
jgi:hypothetical protein